MNPSRSPAAVAPALLLALASALATAPAGAQTGAPTPVPAAAPAAAPHLLRLSAAQRQAFNVETAAPQPAGEALSRRWPARVAVPNAALRVVATPQAGVVDELLVAEGEPVTAGAVLARLVSAELIAAQGSYLDALSQAKLASAELARDRQLFDEGIIAERRWQETRARQREAATAVTQWQQRLTLAGMDAVGLDTLERSGRLSGTLEVRAPISGVVLEQMAITGQAVSAATPLYRVGDLRTLWVEVHVPVDQLAGIAPGASVLLPGVGIEGPVTTVGRMVHGEDQGVLVRAEVRDDAGRLRPGQFVDAQLRPAGNPAARWRLPAAAVVREAGAAYVFVATAEGFAVVPVSVLAEEERTRVVSGALAADSAVAVGGVVALKAAWLAGRGE